MLTFLFEYFLEMHSTAGRYECGNDFFLNWGFTPCKAEKSPREMELQEKQTQKD